MPKFIFAILCLIIFSCRKDDIPPEYTCSKKPVLDKKIAFLNGEWLIKEKVIKRKYYYDVQYEIYDTLIIDNDYKIQISKYGRLILTKGDDTLNDECYKYSYEPESVSFECIEEQDQIIKIFYDTTSISTMKFIQKEYNLPYESIVYGAGYYNTYYYYCEKVE